MTLWARLSDLMAAGQGPRELQWMPGAAPGPRLRTRPVRSQWQLGQPFELRTPVAQLLFGGRRSQPCSLPLNEMPVLDRKLGQLGGVPFTGGIERLELFPEQPLRPSVCDKVMKFDHERMIVLVKPQQLARSGGSFSMSKGWRSDSRACH